MPLHLLGKKSWNVYNTANIERVRRDEAVAREREEAEEQKLQEIDAERRLAILRGKDPPPLPPSFSADELKHDVDRKRHADETSRDWGRGRERKKRKRFGEDDTDFEMRIAREQASAPQTENTLVKGGKENKTSDAPLVDHKGHISLFPDEVATPSQHLPKNAEAEAEAAKKRRAFEDQYTMRFSNAAGRDGLLGTSASGPWYSKGGNTDALVERNAQEALPAKDVWGNEDPRRKEREVARVVSNDPLAMMKRGAARVREVAKERHSIDAEKTRELKQLRKEERREDKKRRRERRHRVKNDEYHGSYMLNGPPRSQDERKDDSGGHKHGSSSRHRQREGEEHYQHRHGNKHYREREERHGDSSRDVSNRQNKSSRRSGGSRRELEGLDKRPSTHDRRRTGRADHY
ncbi:hypothetical protein F5Y15DRAFT_389611 [Xylariaceae sp. FL0016]|nr:hypothetical protein F5Y15DRAFT_389611 [Xylariaceae sp. FL0016]